MSIVDTKYIFETRLKKASQLKSNNMENQFVTYEIALKLKELGFNEECLARYEENILIISRSNLVGNKRFLQVPLWQQSIDWFRTRHGLFIQIGYSKYHNSFNYQLTHNTISNNRKITWCNSFEESREQSIMKAIEFIK